MGGGDTHALMAGMGRLARHLDALMRNPDPRAPPTMRLIATRTPPTRPGAALPRPFWVVWTAATVSFIGDVSWSTGCATWSGTGYCGPWPCCWPRSMQHPAACTQPLHPCCV